MDEILQLRFDEASTIGSSIALAACFTSIILALSQILTMINIVKAKSSGELPIMPYITMITTLSTYFGYGVLMNDLALLIGQGVGTFIGFLYLSIYLTYLNPEKRSAVKVPLIVLLVILALEVYSVATTQVLLISVIAVASNILYYFSPLVTIVKVCKTKSVESMPFLFSFMVFISASTWLVYGFFVKEDVVIWGVCVLGIFFSILQIFCHCLFGCGRNKSTFNEETIVDEKTKNDKVLELMLAKV